jgi:hypothetical protein
MEGLMSFTIRWTPPLNRTERRWLRNWLDRVTGAYPGAVQRHRGAITVRASSPELVRGFAALTMAVAGRPRFAYVLTESEGQTAARPAA